MATTKVKTKAAAKSGSQAKEKPRSNGIRKVGYVDVQNHGHGLHAVNWHDCAGGGQVVVQNKVAYVGNMRNPRDAQRMTSAKGRATYARGLAHAVRTFLR